MIAHSFGTLLFAQLLRHSEYTDLQFGRVILTGSIVPTDFPWQDYIEKGALEAVLNHRAGRDFWVPLAPWFFPNVGPSGRTGFVDLVDDIESPEFGHTSFYRKSYFDSVIRLKWSPFLQGADYKATQPGATLRWGSKYWVGRFALIVVGFGLIVLVLLLVSAGGALAKDLLSILQQVFV